MEGSQVVVCFGNRRITTRATECKSLAGTEDRLNSETPKLLAKGEKDS